LKTEVLVWWCGWNDWLSGSCRGATVRPMQAWKSDVKLTSSSYLHDVNLNFLGQGCGALYSGQHLNGKPVLLLLTLHVGHETFVLQDMLETIIIKL